MHLEEQLRRRLDTIRESIRAKYKSMQSAQRPNDPIRKYLAGEIEKELKGLRDSLSHDEIVQVQTRTAYNDHKKAPSSFSVFGPQPKDTLEF
jgi:hypothetical protein